MSPQECWRKNAARCCGSSSASGVRSRSDPGEHSDKIGKLRVLPSEVVAAAGLVVGIVETRADGAAKEGYLTSVGEARALPHIFRNNELRGLASGKIIAKDHRAAGTVGEKLKHFDGVSAVEMKYLIGGEAVHLGKRAGFEQVVDA